MIFAEDLTSQEREQLLADLKMLAETSGVENVPQPLKRSYHQQRRERLKAAGICVDCGSFRAVPGKAQCEACANKANARAKAFKRIQQKNRQQKEHRSVSGRGGTACRPAAHQLWRNVKNIGGRKKC